MIRLLQKRRASRRRLRRALASGLGMREVPANDCLEVMRVVELLLCAVGKRAEYTVRATLSVPSRDAAHMFCLAKFLVTTMATAIRIH